MLDLLSGTMTGKYVVRQQIEFREFFTDVFENDFGYIYLKELALPGDDDTLID